MKHATYALIAFAGACFAAPFAGAQGTDPTTAPGGPAFHGPPGGGMADPLELLAHLKTKLSLDTSQQQLFDAAVAQSQTSRATIGANMNTLRTALQTQVATGAPDFDALAAQADTLEPVNLAARKQARAAWLMLYDTFSADQKGVVASAILAREARMKARFGQ